MAHPSRPGRRTVLGAAVLGTGAAALAQASGARAATRPARSAGTAPAAATRGPGSLPVPAVIAHRGASGHRPEHTLGSYRLALATGADVIEQDLVVTRDGHLVCRHENEIGGTTDVADHPEFADRRTTRSVDGAEITGWFTEDFTLAELKTLRATERIPHNRPHNRLYDGRWEVPTFVEVLDWARREGRARGRPVWLHVETKHPTHFRERGLEIERPLAKLLREYHLDRADSPLFLQSFEPTSLRRLSQLVDTPRVVLLGGRDDRPWDLEHAGDPRTVADLVSPPGLAWIAGFAQGIGPTVELVIPQDEDGRLTTPTSLVADAHARNLVVHPYTVRNENAFLPWDFRRGADPNDYGDAFGAFRAYFEQGIDGIFTDHPDTGVLAAEDFRAGRG